LVAPVAGSGVFTFPLEAAEAPFRVLLVEGSALRICVGRVRSSMGRIGRAPIGEGLIAALGCAFVLLLVT
jgi:hypothetical protein